MNTTVHSSGLSSKTNDFTKTCVAVCKKLLGRIDAAKTSVLREFSDAVDGHQHLLRLAVNEAEAIAWESEIPYLVFPTLAQEKAQAVAKWADHQQLVRK